MSAREKLDAAKAAYSTAGKNVARAVVMGLAAEERSLTILDLWGGGESARGFRSVLPDATVVSAELDEELWPVMLRDAQEHGYAYHMGDVASVPGRYDLVWLDLCAQASKATEAVIKAVSEKVGRKGYLALTIMPAREDDRVLTSDARTLHLPLWLEGITGMVVTLFLPYRRDNGLPMWLVVFSRDGQSSFHNAERFQVVEKAIVEVGYWAGGTMLLSDAVRDLLDALPWKRRGEQAIAEPDFDEAERPKKIVRMADLNPEMRNIVNALIDGDRHSKRTHLRDEWDLVPA